MLTIYGKKECPYCQMAIQYCHNNNIEFQYYSVEEYPSIRDLIYEAGRRTFPCIFDGSELIGGYEELVDTYSLF